MPILNRARAAPMVRTNLPPIAVVMSPNMCSTRAHLRARPVGVLLPCIERLVAPGAQVDMAPVALLSQACLGRLRAIGTVSPHVEARVGRNEQIVKLLAIVH